jgi:hypothetical protein
MEGAMITKNVKLKTKKNNITKLGISFLPILSIFSFSFLMFHFTKSSDADTLTNNNYSVDVGNIDTNPQPTNTTPQQVLGEQSPKPEFATGPDYTINTSNDNFSFNISQNIIDYGILSATNPVIRNSIISFSGPKFGAEILTYENHPLQSLKNDLIQNTTCDNGSCSPITAAAWDNTLTYGFGYRCDSQNIVACDPQFIPSDYYKQYPYDSINQLPTPVLSNSGHTQTTGTITYKVNISGTQKANGYYNNITYLAIPSF